MRKPIITTLLIAITLLNSGVLLLPNFVSAETVYTPQGTVIQKKDIGETAGETYYKLDADNQQVTITATEAEQIRNQGGGIYIQQGSDKGTAEFYSGTQRYYVVDSEDENVRTEISVTEAARKNYLGVVNEDGSLIDPNLTLSSGASGSATTPAAKSDADTAGVTECSGIFNPASGNTITQCIGSLMFALGGGILGIAGVFMNFSINTSVIRMSEIVGNLGSINAAWKVFRDLANVFFIFILIYIAISTILGLASVSTRKALTNVIIVALLINFSLFGTKVVIDASNIVAVQFYNSITKGAEDSKNGLSWVFMNNSRLTSVFKTDNIKDLGKDTNFLLIGFLSLIFFIVLSICFIAIGLLFLIRFAVLIFLMILSPLAFLGYALPPLASSWEDWKKTLAREAIFAPFMMAMLWVVAAMSNGMANSLKPQGPISWAEALSGQSGTAVTVIVNFAILIIMLIAGMAVSKKFSGSAGGAVLGMADKWSRKAVSYVPASAARFGVGGASRLAGKGYDAVEARLKDTKTGRVFSTAANMLTLGGAGALNRGVRQTLAKGEEEVKFGLEKSYKGRIEEDKQRATTLAQIRSKQQTDTEQKKQMKILEDSASTPDQKEEARRIIAQIYAQKSSKEVEEELNTGKLGSESLAMAVSLKHIEALKKSDTANKTALEKLLNTRFKNIDDVLKLGTTASATAIADMQKIIRGMSDKEVELLGYIRLSNQGVAKALNQDHLDNLKKSSEYTPSQIKHINDERQNAISATISASLVGGLATIQHEIADMKLRDKDIAKLDKTILKDVRFNQIYTVGMLQEIAKEPSVSANDRRDIRNNLTAPTSGVRPQIITWLNGPAGAVI